MLLREGVSEEEIMFPTIAFAAAGGAASAWRELLATAWSGECRRSSLSDLAGGLYDYLTGPPWVKEWLSAAEVNCWSFISNEFMDYYAVLPLAVVDGVVLLLREPVQVGFLYESQDAELPCETTLSILQGPKRPPPELVAKTYRSALSKDGIPWSEEYLWPTKTEHRVSEGLLVISVYPGSPPRPQVRFNSKPVKVDNVEDLLKPGASSLPEQVEKLAFPPPEWVEHYYAAVLKMGESREIRGRPGPAPDPNHFIPACVAWFLSSLVGGRKEVHRLLNKHVLHILAKELPEEGFSTSETNRLWRDANKVGARLRKAYAEFRNPCFEAGNGSFTYEE